ncbi:Oligopeptide transport system permease protein OppC (TC 3.A.1.5.1) [Helicobacter bizzozeronii CCUG 35545]|nr:Oligopeptide transport system permease protein OppC (TC 3.A.1.5.1) [Helicobacter bizzozeronii CCUG 35545]
MPVGSASLGELLNQGKNNLYAPHLALVGFFAIALLLSILVFYRGGGQRCLQCDKLQISF